jgi:hypothetical protein
MTDTTAAAAIFPAAEEEEVAAVEEPVDTTVLVDGTTGKTINDFVERYNFEKGTGRTYATMVKGKWWNLYCVANGITGTSPPILVKTDDDGRVTGIETTLVRKVLVFMEEQVTAGTTSAANYKKMVKSLSWFQNKQRNAGGMSSVKEAIVALPGVRENTSMMRKRAATSDRENHVDLQIGFTDALTTEEKEGLGLLGLMHTALPSPLGNATVDYDVKNLLATGGRGEDVRNSRKTDLGTTRVTGLGGASSGGTMAITTVINDGKTIGTSGQKLRRVIPPHQNPAQDTAASMGCMLTTRHSVLQEPVTLPTELVKSFMTRMSRSPTSSTASADYQTQLAQVKALLRKAAERDGWSINKQHGIGTHFMRHDSAQTMGNAGVDEEEVIRTLSQPQTPLTQTYMTGPALNAIAVLAGFLSKELYFVSWLVDVPLETCFLLAPWLKQELDALATLTEGVAGLTTAQVKERRLVALEQSTNARELAISSFICAAAARPYKGGMIDKGSAIIRDLCKSTNQALNLPFFESDQFRAVVANVQLAQNAEIEANEGLTIPSPIKDHYESVIKPRDERMLRQGAEYKARQAENTALLVQILGMVGQQQQQQQQPVMPATGAVLAPAAAMAAAAKEGGTPVEKKKGAPRSANVQPGKGHAHIREFRQFRDADSIYTAYNDGVNGCASYKSLEAAGKGWRRYNGGRQAWGNFSVLGRFLDREEGKGGGTRESAIEALQEKADAAGKRGKSKAPNWKGVVDELRGCGEEKERKRKNKEDEDEKKKKAKGQAQ